MTDEDRVTDEDRKRWAAEEADSAARELAERGWGPDSPTAPLLAPLAAHGQPVPVTLTETLTEPARSATAATWAILAAYVVAVAAYAALSLLAPLAAGLPGLVAIACVAALLSRR